MFKKFLRQLFSLKTEASPFKKPTMRSCYIIGLVLAMNFALAYANPNENKDIFEAPLENRGRYLYIIVSWLMDHPYITSAKGLGG